jgi:hypothetical protein
MPLPLFRNSKLQSGAVLHLLYMQFSLKNAEDPEAAKKAVGFPMSLQKTKAVGFPMSLQKKNRTSSAVGPQNLRSGGLKVAEDLGVAAEEGAAGVVLRWSWVRSSGLICAWSNG